MGTNFYWRTDLVTTATLPTGDDFSISFYRDDPLIHIGKRSAAGQYCWDCDRTLCAGGNDDVHMGRSAWYDRCPSCGKEPTNVDNLSEGPAAVELGFAQPSVQRPTGVRGASSFSWAQDPERVGAICDARPEDELIEDEYGRVLTGREFIEMVRANCPIQFTKWIGTEFS